MRPTEVEGADVVIVTDGDPQFEQPIDAYLNGHQLALTDDVRISAQVRQGFTEVSFTVLARSVRFTSKAESAPATPVDAETDPKSRRA